MKTYTIRMKHQTLTDAMLRVTTYAADNSPCLIYGQRMPLSVNLGDYGLRPPEGHVFVRDYGEFEGLADALVEAGVAEKVHEVTFGRFSTKAWLMRLLIDKKPLFTEEEIAAAKARRAAKEAAHECAEGGHVNDDNPGRPICRTCDDDPAVADLYPTKAGL